MELPEIGTQFTPKRKIKRLHTVVDIHTVTNIKGEIVRKDIIAEFEFFGQTLRTVVPLSTIALSKK